MISRISVSELARQLAGGASPQLLDVRQPWEHATAALPGSTLIPLDELPRRVGELGRPGDAPIVVYCHHGVRSLSGAMILIQAGFTNVSSLDGGIDEWSRRIDPRVATY